MVASVRSVRRTLKSALAQHRERLRRRHLVHEMQIDVEHGGRRLGLRLYEMIVPELREQRSRRECCVMT